MSLELDRELVVSLESESGEKRRVLRALQDVGMKEAVDEKTGETLRPNIEHRIEEESELTSELLTTLGIPPYDIVRIASSQGEEVYLLAGDRDSEMTKFE